jgi:hypothetical protein
MSKTNLPSPEVLRKIMRYEPDTGKLFWLERSPSLFGPCTQGAQRAANVFNSRYANKEAFTSACKRGYMRGRIFMTNAYAHRVAWCLYYGGWPSIEVDHINQNKSDNRISNLRLATPSENRCNRGKQKNNKSGFKGVKKSATEGKWVSYIRANGKCYYIGTFPSKNEAHLAYVQFAEKLHGEFLAY